MRAVGELRLSLSIIRICRLCICLSISLCPPELFFFFSISFFCFLPLIISSSISSIHMALKHHSGPKWCITCECTIRSHPFLGSPHQFPGSRVGQGWVGSRIQGTQGIPCWTGRQDSFSRFVTMESSLLSSAPFILLTEIVLNIFMPVL